MSNKIIINQNSVGHYQDIYNDNSELPLINTISNKNMPFPHLQQVNSFATFNLNQPNDYPVNYPNNYAWVYNNQQYLSQKRSRIDEEVLSKKNSSNSAFIHVQNSQAELNQGGYIGHLNPQISGYNFPQILNQESKYSFSFQPMDSFLNSKLNKIK